MWSFFSRDPTKDFPYDIGDPVDGLGGKSIWSLHKAKKKSSVGEDVSVFIFQAKSGAEYQLDIARAAVKKLKTLRHPSILSYLDSLETDKIIYLATERVEPLNNRLSKLSSLGSSDKQNLYLSWGLFQITRALSFLNNDGNLRHNNVNLWSVFVNEETGEWKLGGLEYMTTVDSLYKSLPKSLQLYQPPEIKENFKPATKCAIDSWGLGCFIWEIFNGSLCNLSNLEKKEKIPKKLNKLYTQLVNGKAQDRPNPADIIAQCRSTGEYFSNNLVDAILFLEQIQVKEKGEKARFFSQLTSQLEDFPEGVGRYKILPQLIAAFEYGDAGSTVLPPLLQLGSSLPDNEYQKRVVPCVVKLFASNDRATRMKLLQQLEKFAHHLQPNTVNEAIFPQVVRGFLDTNPAVREQTVKSFVYLAPKLDYNNLNVELLRHFAKLQSKDEQGGIRTNTTICLGKIAQNLHPQIRQKVLIGAFLRGTRDPFSPARIASILALVATQQYFLIQEVANKVLPGLCSLTNDPDKSVRDNAFRAIKGFLSKLEKLSEDPSLRESMEVDVNTATPSIGNAAASWAGWAVTAVTSKFYKNQSENIKSPTSSGNLKTMPRQEISEDLSLRSTKDNHPKTASDSSNVGDLLNLHPNVGSPTIANVGSDGDWDGWDTGDWGDMEQEITSSSQTHLHLNSKNHPQLSQWDNFEEKSKDNEDEESGWENTEFLPLEDIPQVQNLNINTSEADKLEEARKKREEKKLERQRILEAKRAAKSVNNTLAKKL